MSNDSTSPRRYRAERTPQRQDGREPDVSRRDLLRLGAAGAVGAAVGVTGLSGSAAAADIPTPALSRDGNLLVDPQGNTVTLRGVNMADPKRIDVTAPARGMNAVQVVDFLTDHGDDWFPRAIRVPVQPVDIGEYEPGSGPPVPAFDQAQLETYLADHLDDVVQRCAERGVYCIVDYHRHRDVMWAEGQDGPINQELHDEVDTFWDTVAPRYADQSHVLYEVYNEPTEPGMWEDPTTTQWVADVWQLWLEMAQPWVDTIRSHADNLILMGSPSWSQSPEGALVEEFDGDDIAYTFHIYPGHNSSMQNDWEDASINGEGVAGVYEQAPLVVTEFGWEENAGQYIGGTTSGFGDPFLEFLGKSEAISWTAWIGDPIWRPVMFDRPFTDSQDEDSIGNPYQEEVPVECEDRPCEWELLGGDAHMGQRVKDVLFDLRNDNVPGGGSDDTTPPTVPGAPSVTGTTATSVSVDWSASSDDGTGVDSYDVSVDGSLATSVSAGTTSATVNGLDPETTYQIGVSAVDAVGNESDTATVEATTDEVDDGEAPTAPSNLAVEATSAASVDVSWDASTDSGGSGLDSYVVSVDGTEDQTVGADATTATVSGLGPETTYEIGVSAVDAAGNESDAATVEATTDAEPEEPPEGDLIAEMDPSTTAPEVGERVAFQVTDTTDSGNWITALSWDLGNGDTDSGWYTETTYDSEETFTAALTATNNEDASTTHEVGIVVGDGGEDPDPDPEDDEAPTTPSNLSVTGTTDSSISVDWDASSDSGGSGLDGYIVSLDGSQDHSVSAGTTSTTVTGLAANTQYTVGVSAVDGAGNESATVSVQESTDADDGGDVIAELDPSTTSAGVGDRITFQVVDTSGSGNWITDLQWDFGDGTTATGWWNAHTYDSAGSYTVALTATDDEGESTTYEVTITVE